MMEKDFSALRGDPALKTETPPPVCHWRWHLAGDTLPGGVSAYYRPICQGYEGENLSTQGGSMTRVIAYIDGFNFYFVAKRKGWKRYYWLDLVALATDLLKPGQILIEIHYFTARIRADGNNHADMQRQADYLDALATLDDLHIHYGHYLKKPRKCHGCGEQWMDYEEGMTCVNIAVQLLADTFDNRFDTALIVSADSDLTAPVQFIRNRFQNKHIIVARPPGRYSAELKRAANAAFTLSKTKMRQNQLPDVVSTPSGFILKRPATWR